MQWEVSLWTIHWCPCFRFCSIISKMRHLMQNTYFMRIKLCTFLAINMIFIKKFNYWMPFGKLFTDFDSRRFLNRVWDFKSRAENVFFFFIFLNCKFSHFWHGFLHFWQFLTWTHFHDRFPWNSVPKSLDNFRKCKKALN